MRQAQVSILNPKQVWLPTSTRKGAKPSRRLLTLKNPNEPFGEITSGVRKASQSHSTRRIFIETIRIDILVAKVMMTSYSEEEITPKTSKVKFIKPSTSSTRTMVPRPLQVREVTPPSVPTKRRRILRFSSQSQSDVTSCGVESQAYSGSIARSRAKVLAYAEVTLQSSDTTFYQGKDQLEEQDEVTSPTFYDLGTLFQEEESSVVISQSQIIEDDQVVNMSVASKSK